MELDDLKKLMASVEDEVDIQYVLEALAKRAEKLDAKNLYTKYRVSFADVLNKVSELLD